MSTVKVGDIIQTQLNYPNGNGERLLTVKILTDDAAKLASKLVDQGSWYVVKPEALK